MNDEEKGFRENRMKMVVSLTIDSSFLRKVLKILNEYDYVGNLLEAVLVTPLFASRSTLDIIRNLKDHFGSTIYFDSGGYYAQQGKIRFRDLYRELLNFYKNPENRWGDWYVLPDYPPTSTDSFDVVESKVKDTITAARMFYAEMPPEIKERSMPVIHGRSLGHITLCLKAYENFNYLGFGSFSTSGGNDSINVVSHNSLQIVSYVSKYLHNKGKHLHVFGVSTPPVVYTFYMLGVYSFDSMAWLRSAGYGKVFLPFVRAYNITHCKIRNSSLTKDEFEMLKEVTGHDCPFCENFTKLQESRIFRALHNLISMKDTLELSTCKSIEEISEIIYKKSNQYYKKFREVIE